MFGKKKLKDKMGVLGWALLICLLAYALVMCSFLVFGVFTSINTKEVYDHKIYFPDGKEWVWAFDNYVKVFGNFVIDDDLLYDGTIGYANFMSMTLNSIAVAGGGALVSTISFFLVAYVTAKFPYFFSKVIHTFVIVTMVIPIVGATPSYIVILQSMGLYQTLLGEYVMKFNFLGMYFLVFYAIFQGISKDYAEAAQLDGASEFTIMVRIMLPLVMPTFSTIFLIRFIESWNDYNYIILYLKSYPTLSYGVYRMVNENVGGMDHPTLKIASSLLVALPILTLFIIFRNKIMGNVTMGGVKE